MNEYDQLLTEGNEYDQIVEGEATLQNARVRTTLMGAVDINPDEFAQARKLSMGTGIPAPVVARNLKLVDNKVKVNEYDQLLQDSPKLRDKMADRDFANVAHDDLTNLSAIEKLQWKNLQKNTLPADVGSEFVKGLGGSFNFLNMYGGLLLGGATKILDYVSAISSEVLHGGPPTNLTEFIFRKFVEPSIQRQAAYETDPETGLPGKMANSLGNMLGLMSQIILSGGQNTTTTLANPTALKILQAEAQQTVKNSSIVAVKQATETANSVMQNGGTGEDAALAGMTQYFTTLGTFFGPMSIPGNVATRSLSGAASGYAATELGRKAMNLALPEDQQQPEISAEDMVVNMATSAFMASVMGPRANTYHADNIRAVRAQEAYAMFREEAAIASKSSLRIREANTFKQLMKDIHEGNQENAYIDGNTLNDAFNQHGVTPEEIQRKMPQVAEQLNTAVSTGGEVRVPMEDLATNIFGKPIQDSILPHLKPDPGGMTFDQSQAFLQNQTAEMQVAAEKIIAEKQAEDTFRQSAKIIEDNILGDLNAVGRYSPDANKLMAKSIRSFYIAQADRLGISPSELYLGEWKDPVTGEVQPPLQLRVGGDLTNGFEQNVIREESNAKSIKKNLKKYPGDFPPSMPQEIRDEIIKWNVVSKSPYSESFYDITNKSWDDDPDTFLRVADHWAFYSGGRIHAQTDIPVNDGDWTLAEHRADGLYHVIKSVPRHHYDSPEFSANVEITKRDIAKQVAARDLKVAKIRKIINDSVGKAIAIEPVNPLKGAGFNRHFLDLSKSDKRRAFLIDKLFPKHIDEIWINRTSKRFVISPEIADIPLENLDSAYNATIGMGKLFNQSSESSPIASFNPEKLLIGLTKASNLSSFHHEAGHFFLEATGRLASIEGAPESIKADMDKTLDWLGVKGDDSETALQKWQKMSIDEQRPYHEQFAKGYETYLMEGKAPSLEAAGMFQRFKAWMLQTYQSLKDLGVKLTPEIRGVYDRLLATDAQIKQAEEARSMLPMFEQIPEGMTPKEFEDYKILNQEASDRGAAELGAKNIDEMKWFEGAKNKALKAIQKSVADVRKGVRAEVAAQVSEEPVYRAQRLIKENSGVEGKTADLDFIADQAGFRSVEEMGIAIKNARPLKEEINLRTDQRMLEEHGQTLEDMQAAADQAVHNELRLKVLATQYKVLTKSKGPIGLITKAAKEAAQNIVGEKRIRDLLPAQFTSAEARAGKAAMEAYAKGDVAEAIKQQRNQILNNQLAKAVMDGKDESQKAINYFNKFNREGTRKNLRGEFLDQIDNVLDRFDFRKSATLKSIDPLKDFLKSESERLSAVIPDLPEFMLNDGYRRSYKDMTLNELMGLRDGIRQMEKMARREQDQYLAIRNQTFQQEREANINVIKKNFPEIFDENGEVKTLKREIQSLKKMMNKSGERFEAEFINPENILSIVERGEFGPLHESLFGRLNKGADLQAEEMKLIYNEMKPIYKQWNKLEKIAYGTKDIGTEKVGVPLTRENVVMIAAYYGNKEGRLRLYNDDWNDTQIQQMIGLLDKRDLNLVEAMWKVFDQNLWPKMVDLNVRTRGKAPPKVEATPFTVNGREMRGGYMHLSYDSDLSERHHTFNEGAAITEILGNGYGMSAKTRQGTSTERKAVVKDKLLLNLSVFPRTVSETVHDIAYREAVADTIRMLRDDTMTAALKQAVGQAGYRALVQKVRDTAAPMREPSNMVERAMNVARRNTIVTLLSGVKTALQNFTGIASAYTRIDPVLLSKEIGNFYSTGMIKSTQFAMENSSFMRGRFDSYERDLMTNHKELTVNGKIMPDTSIMLGMISMVDRATTIPAWNAAYKEGMGKFDNDHSKSVDYADHIVRQTMGSGRALDLPAIMSRKGIWPVFTMIHSYFNQQLQLLVLSGAISKAEAKTNPALATAKFAARYLAIVAVPAVITDLMFNGFEDSDDPKRWAKAMGLYMAGMFPVVRDVAKFAASKYDPDAKYHQTNFKLSPIESTIETAVNLPHSLSNIIEGESSDYDQKQAIMGLSFLLGGLPGKLISDVWLGTNSWLEGQSGPEAVLLGPERK